MKTKKRIFRVSLAVLCAIALAATIVFGALSLGGGTDPLQTGNVVPLNSSSSSAATEQVKDAEGNLLVPFDLAYPDAFSTGEYEYQSDTVLLKMKDTRGAVGINLKKLGVSSLSVVTPLNDGTVWYRAAIGRQNVKSFISEARALPEVIMADYDYIYRTEAIDPEASSLAASSGVVMEELSADVRGNGQIAEQWYLNAGELQKSWKWLKDHKVDPGGDPSVVVAVIDTGVDYDHPDLKDNMWFNQGEIQGDGIDNDGNGYVDDYFGYNAVAENGNPQDDHGHGTHVAGIIAASNNKVGGVGIAYNTKIMAVKAGQASGVFTQSDIAEAIRYAYQNGADVINMSFGGSAISISVQDALTDAYTTATLVAAAGNDGMPNESADFYPPLPNYPAALSYVIGVMSVDKNGTESGFSNWDVSGFNSIEYELYAPGEAILSTLPGQRYGQLSGTSMAAPIVSGAAALLRSYYKNKDTYPSKFIAGQLAATSEDAANCCNPQRHTVNGLPHNTPMIFNLYSALTKRPKPEVGLYDYYLFDSKTLDEKNTGDGVVDAGETIAIGAVLRNRWGMSKDTFVTIDTQSGAGMSDPYVKITRGGVNFDGVGTYSTKDTLTRTKDGIINGVENPLTIEIDKDCPNDYRVVLHVTVTCKNGLDEEDNQQYTTEGAIEFIVRNGVILMGIIDEDTTLTSDNFYIVPASLYIPEGVTVTVEKGARIQFWTDDPQSPYADVSIASLNVAGEFICNGTPEEPVEIFPSEFMGQYIVEIFSSQTGKTNGYIELNYTNVTNPKLTIDRADHCYFSQVYAGELYCREYESGKFNDGHPSSPGIHAEQVTNSIFYALGGGNVRWHSPTSVQTNPSLYGTYESCIFLDSGLQYSGNFKNCVFSGARNLHAGSAEDDGSMFILRPDTVFEGNAIINDFNQTDLSYWFRLSASQNSGNGVGSIDVSGNYWGTLDETIINRHFIDFEQISTLQDIDAGSYLTEAPSDVWPFVVDAHLENAKGERVRTVSNEKVTFVIEFNRPMDTKVPLRVRFGSSEPFAEYEVEGEYVTSTQWRGTYTLQTMIENGNQFIRIENGRAADDKFLSLYEHAGRWSFEIDTAKAQELIMSADPTKDGISLKWEQDDFVTLAGYNVYRSEDELGYYTRINPYVIPADTKEFFDNTVEPGKMYYYNFTVVQTDFTESAPSGKISVRSFDTMAPSIYHTPVREAFTGSNLNISALVTDNLQISSATLFYRTVGEENWKSTQMHASNSRYTGYIPADALTTDGIEYYLSVSDGVNTTEFGSAEDPYEVTVKLAIDASSLGDVDGDGSITAKDALMLLQAVNGLYNLSNEEFARADIDKDDHISAQEALIILQYVSGKRTSITG